MKRGGGNLKGGKRERDVCRQLSLWLSNGERDDLLWRSAMSGGRATIQFNAGKINANQAGDVSAIGAEAFEFCSRTYVEVKHYRDLQFDRWFICGTGIIATFWKDTVEQARRYNKRPLLIARQNRYPVVAVTDFNQPVFTTEPIVQLYNEGAVVHLFDPAVRVKRKMVRHAV